MRRPACWNSARRRSVPSCVASSRSRATRSGTHAWSRRSVPIKTKKILSCCKPQTWGWLGQDCPAADIRAYCYPHDLYALQDVDIVLIDGRFRVACALFCFLALRSDVLFDDFWDRAETYAMVLDYFSIMDTRNDRMVVLRKRTDVSPPSDAVIERSLQSPY